MENYSKLFYAYEISTVPASTEVNYWAVCAKYPGYSDNFSLIDFYAFELRNKLSSSQNETGLRIIRDASKSSIIVGFEIEDGYDLEDIKSFLITLRDWNSSEKLHEISGKSPEFISAEICPEDEDSL